MRFRDSNDQAPSQENTALSLGRWQAHASFSRTRSMFAADEVFQQPVNRSPIAKPSTSLSTKCELTRPPATSQPKLLDVDPSPRPKSVVVYRAGLATVEIQIKAKLPPRKRAVIFRVSPVPTEIIGDPNEEIKLFREEEIRWMKREAKKSNKKKDEPQIAEVKIRERRSKLKIDPSKIGMKLIALNSDIYLDIVDIYDRTLGGSGREFARAEELKKIQEELQSSDVERKFNSRLGWAKLWFRNAFCHNDPRGENLKVLRFDAVIYHDQDKRARQLERLFRKRVSLYLIERNLAIRLD